MPLWMVLLAFFSPAAFSQETRTMMGLPLNVPGDHEESSGESTSLFRFTSEAMGECPKTLEEWKTWRREKFLPTVQNQSFKLLKENGEGELTIGAGSVGDFIRRCRPGQETIHDRPEFQACFQRIVEMEKISGEFISSIFEKKKEKTPSVDGFPPSYTAANLRAVAANTEKPEQKEKLLAALKTLTDGAKQARAIRFDSAVIKGLDSLVILDVRPDGTQFWTHFSLGSSKPEDFLSIRVTPAGNHEGKSTFQMHALGHSGDLERRTVDVITCLQCHRTSPISLVSKDPKQIQVSLPEGEKDGLKVMAEMNEHIAEVALALPEKLNLAPLGPARGPAKKRPIEYLRRLATKTSTPAADDAALKRVAPHMNCVKCHDGSSIANTIGEQLLFPGLFENYVVHGHMPPKANLSKEDAKLLSELINVEYYGGYPTIDKSAKETGILADWLNESCPWAK